MIFMIFILAAEDPDVDSVRQALHEGINTRWTQHLSGASVHEYYLLPILFDPRTKDNAFRLLPESERVEALRLAREAYEVLSEPSRVDESDSSNLHQTGTFWSHVTPMSRGDQFDEYMRAKPCPVENECKSWFQLHTELNIGFTLFKKWCCVHASATSVERLWSRATYLDDRLRARMSPDLLADRLFLQKNQPVKELLKL